MLCVGLLGNFPHSALSTLKKKKKKGTQLLSLTSAGVTHTFTSKDRDNGSVSFNISTVSSVAGSSWEGVIGHLSVQHGNPELENVNLNRLIPCSCHPCVHHQQHHHQEADCEDAPSARCDATGALGDVAN